SVREMEEPGNHLNRGLRIPAKETLGLVTRDLGAICCPAVCIGVEAAHRPSLPVLDGRPIGIEDVSLVQHRVRDAIQVLAVHGVLTSTPATSSSTALSQLDRPREAANRCKESNTSLLSLSQALLG